MTRNSSRFRYLSERLPAAIVVAVQEPHQSAHQTATSALELARLARGLGIEVVRTVQQSRANASLSALLSEGRLRELAALTGGVGPVPRGPQSPPTPAASERDEDDKVDLVLIDGLITGGQQRALELALGVEVLDRSAVILRVFEQRARSHEARLQVALARELYQAPRVRDDHGLGDREGGGGRAARGHTNVELRKQQHRERVATLRRELAALPAREAVRRQRRDQMSQAALVGYTNAGKSSLMRALTGSQVHVEDELFATVDLTVRTLAPESTPRILVSDTVGFLANLPHELVASFRATLEEARHADVLLLVVDAADPDLHDQLRVTLDTLRQIGADSVPRQLVLNKVDRLTPQQRESLALLFPDAWLVSAHDADDVAALRARLVAHFERALVEGSLLVPFRAGALLDDIHRQARVLARRHTTRGTRLHLRAPPDAWARWNRALKPRHPDRG